MQKKKKEKDGELVVVLKRQRSVVEVHPQNIRHTGGSLISELLRLQVSSCSPGVTAHWTMSHVTLQV